MLQRSIIISICSIALLFSVFVLSEDKPTDIRLLMGSETTVRINYEVDFINLALEKSKDKYGVYTFTVLKKSMTYLREFRALESDFGQISTATIRPEALIGYEKVERLTQSIFNGLLGYRQCIVRKEDAERFSEIKTSDDLKAFRIGQGHSWADVAFFQENAFEVVLAEKFDRLIPMLNSHRFDCLSLGLLESALTLEERISQYPDLLIVPNLVIFYPIDVHVYVSKARPDINERLTYGMAKAQQDGSAEALFRKYFSNELTFLQNPQLRLITPMPTSQLPENEPQLMPQYINAVDI